MRLTERLKRLEQTTNARLPFVVLQLEREPLALAVARALGGRIPQADWTFIVAPETLSVDEWLRRYGPPP